MKKFLLTLLILLSLAVPSSAEYMSDLIVTGTAGIWTDSRSYTTLADAITAIGATNQTLYIAREEAATALTIPANVRLKFIRSGAINNTGQLIINTFDIESDHRQIFTGTGDIDFAQGSYVKSSWFSNISEAVDVTSDDTLTLEISEPDTITVNCAVGNDVQLKWLSPRNRLVVAAGITMSNIGQVEAGDYQLFAGAGDFDFRDGANLNLKWFARLRSALAWIEDERVTIIVPGDNTVDYSETAPSNVVFDFKSRYGLFNVSAGVTLTVYSSSNIIANDNQQIVSLTGTANLSFTSTGTKAYFPWWGAKGDAGVTDNNDNATTGLLAKALSVTSSVGGTLVIPEYGGYYHFSVGATVPATADNGTIICDGRMKFTGTTEAAITIGDGTTAQVDRFTIGGRGLWIEASDTDWSNTHIGLDLKGLNDADIKIKFISGFLYGINLSGATYGVRYSKFNLDYVIDNKIDLYLSTDTNNENNFYGGRFSSNLSAHTGDLDDSYGIYISSANNNNRFWGPSIEEGSLSKKDYKIYCNGTHNSFYNPRFETVATKCHVYLDTSSQANSFYYGYPSYGPRTNNSIIDVGTRNNVFQERIQVLDGVQYYRPTAGGIVVPATGNWKIGDIYWAVPNSTASHRETGFVCITSGTYGGLNGGATTGSINVGEATLTVSSVVDLYRNSYITVAGVTGTKKVIDIVGLVATLDSVSDATVAAAAVDYATPDFKPFGHSVVALPNVFNSGVGEEGMVAWNPDAMNDGDVATQTVNVTGAEFGDFVMVSCGESLVGCTLTGYVSAADTVTFLLKNTSGGIVNIGNTWFWAKVFKWYN